VSQLLVVLWAAIAVSLGNLAVAIGIGISGADRSTKIKMTVVFALFEAGMPLIGLYAGHRFADAASSLTSLLGGGLLIVAGAWNLLEARSSEAPPSFQRSGQVLMTGLALSLDNLVVGVGMGAQGVRLLNSAVIFAVVSIVVSIVGLQLGKSLGSRLERGTEYVGGLTLIVLGVLFLFGLI
jgi:putative Mn2+ efflux pump MntP